MAKENNLGLYSSTNILIRLTISSLGIYVIEKARCGIQTKEILLHCISYYEVDNNHYIPKSVT